MKQLSDEHIKYLQETLYKLIEHAVARIHYAESRRSSFVTVGGALFAASFAVIALTLPNVHFFPLRLALISASLSGVLVSLSIWVMYARQTNFRYPFTAVTTTWKWFYRDALPERNSFNVPFHLHMTDAAFAKGKEAFTNQWPQFEAAQVQGLTDIRTSTYQDLQQMYVLHVNDYYKNLFLTHLRSLLQIGIVIILIVFGIALGLGFVLQKREMPASGVSVNSAVTLWTAWRRTGRIRAVSLSGSDVQFLINGGVRHRQNTHISVHSLAVKDSQGLRLPMFAASLSPFIVLEHPRTRLLLQ